MISVLIITGMHRSATSLVASLFERAGLDLGDQLLAPDHQNPLGFFEDVDLFNFHEQVLRSRGQNILVPREFTFTPTSEERAAASALIAARAGKSLWGWKDPRTSLLLDFWDELLPAARYLLLYRHPYEVLLSLLRRGEWFLWGLLEALEAWYAYNSRLLAFAERHPDRVLLCHSYAVVDRIEAFNSLLEKRLAYKLDLDAARTARYDPAQLRRAPLTTAHVALLERIHPDSLALYAALNERADLPPDTIPLTSAAPALESLAAWSAAQPDWSAPAARRGLLLLLLGLDQPDLVEDYYTEPQRKAWQVVNRVDYLEHERAGWERLAHERERVALEQQAWAQQGMDRLVALEASPWVRALRRLGLLSR